MFNDTASLKRRTICQRRHRVSGTKQEQKLLNTSASQKNVSKITFYKKHFSLP